jgi:hypothetical protein
MEVTLTELWLFVWALVATGYAINRHEEARIRTQMLRVMFLDKPARSRLLNEFDAQQEKINASES